ncbi:MAG: hypothetical protein H0X37_19330 [Herpetosiphonaceae bacterium]|nr:hypothetical protein [Herpetosiphonaceae bacterium]
MLWPPGSRRGMLLALTTFEDLALEELVRALDIHGHHLRAVRATVGELPVAPDIIAYRQAIMADLLAHPALVAECLALLPQLASLSHGPANWPDDAPLLEVAARVVELDHFVQIVMRLHLALQSAVALASPGLLALLAAVEQIAASPTFSALQTELPRLQEQLGEAGSVTLGINLDTDLSPSGAILVSIQREKFGGGRSLLGRLLGKAADDQRIGMLHRAISHPLGDADGVLRRDLDRLLSTILQPVASSLRRYREFTGRPFAALEHELAFWLGAVALDTKLNTAGISCCHPVILPQHERRATITGMINLALALRLLPEHTVANNVSFDDAGRILIVTGPNHGGKTTFLRAIGQLQVMFQLGLRVAAQAAALTPVDAILTHFPQQEGVLAGVGRLDDEAQRLATIFRDATASSLILFNEPLTSTSEREAFAIARDVLRGLQLLGARTVFVTHLHALAADLTTFNEDGAEQVTSLVAGVDETRPDDRRTYRIIKGPPRGSSYAADIAARHGLTWEQLAKTIRRQ